MDKKYNLSEAAAEILAASVNGKRSQRDSGPSKLSGAVAYGTKEVGDIGTQVTKTTDSRPDLTKGAPTATPPGATPPVGSEPMKKLKGQPGESGSAEHPEGKSGRQMMDKNRGATFQSYGESVEEEDYEEEEDEEDDVLREAFIRTPGHIKKHLEDLYGPAQATITGKDTVQHITRHLNDDGEDAEEVRTHELIGKGKDSKVGKLIKHTKPPKEFFEETEEGHEDEAQDKKMMKKMMKKKDMKEDIDALLQGENLSEEFASKAATIFEAAVNSRVTEIAEELQVELQEQFADAIDHLKEEFTTKIDDYLNYMVEEWMKENELAIESGLRTEIVEDFIGGMRNLFAEHYIDIPEEKVDVVGELAAKVEELEEKLNEEMHRSIQFKKEINEHKKLEAVQTVCEGLTQTQVEKLKSLAETVEFTTDEEFADKLETLKEAYTGTSSVKFGEKSALEEGIDVEEVKSERVSHDPLIDAVAKSISKSVIK